MENENTDINLYTEDLKKIKSVKWYECKVQKCLLFHKGQAYEKIKPKYWMRLSSVHRPKKTSQKSFVSSSENIPKPEPF